MRMMSRGYGRKITGNTGYLSQAGGVPCVIHTDSGDHKGLFFEYGDERSLRSDRADRSHLALVYNATRPWVGWVKRERVELVTAKTSSGGER